MINGISSEKPALDFVRCIEYVWSAYEVMGEMIMKMGAMKPVTNDTIPILRDWAPDTRRNFRDWGVRDYILPIYRNMYKKRNRGMGARVLIRIAGVSRR